MLAWERELIGLYLTDHPLTPYQQGLAQIVTHFSGQLGGAPNQEKVKVAGLITTVRPYVTKAGKPMGFATVEDIQGNIELVLFPRTWEKTREQLTIGTVIIVDGKVDATNTPPKILVDAIRTDVQAAIEQATSGMAAKPGPGSSGPPPKRNPQPAAVARPPSKPSAARQVAEQRPAVATPNNSSPPPPDNFPAGWDAEWQPSFENAEIATRVEPGESGRGLPRSETVTEARPEKGQPLPTSSTSSAETLRPAQKATPTPAAVKPPETHVLPSLYIPLAQTEVNREHPPRQITVMLRSTGDRERDKRRIRTIYGTLISFHGRDRFSFHIFEDGKGFLMDFPGETTQVCDDMLARLRKLTGEENWRVEDITFQ